MGPDGVVYIESSNAFSGAPINIYRVVPGGSVAFLFQANPSANRFRDLAVAPDGSIYFGGGSFAAVDAFRPDGSRERYAGKNGGAAGTGDGGAATEAGFSQPTRFRVTQTGELYLLESARVRRVDAMGVITRVPQTT